MRPALLLCTLCLVLANAAEAQRSGGCCTFRDWLTWRASDPLRHHPTAHSLGGAGMLLVARGPWFSPRVRDRRWKRLAIVGIGGALWQAQNLKEIQGYRWDYAAWDLGANLVAALALDLALGEP